MSVARFLTLCAGWVVFATSEVAAQPAAAVKDGSPTALQTAM